MILVVHGRVCFKAEQGKGKTTRWQCCTAASLDGIGTACIAGRSLLARDPQETRDTELPPGKGCGRRDSQDQWESERGFTCPGEVTQADGRESLGHRAPRAEAV